MTPEASSNASETGILTLEIADKAALHSAYMSFIQNGGLFVPAKAGEPNRLKLGDDVFLLLNLMEQGERIPIAGKVVWLTPSGAQGQRVPGVGIQFSSQDGGATQQKIESLLGGSVDSDRPTNTL